MTTPTPDLRILEIKCAAQTNCTQCRSPIQVGQDAFLDLMAALHYCPQCGVNLRFHRKRAAQRGEALPVSFQDVEVRLSQREVPS